MHDLRLAIRSLKATPLVSAVAVLSLALGIGANAGIFSIVNGLLLRSLPVADAERLVTASTDSAVKLGFNAGIGWAYRMWEAFQPRAGAFDGAFACYVQPLNTAEVGEAQPLETIVASGGIFTTLGVQPAIGRLLGSADDAPGGGPDGPAVVISHALWQSRFGGAQSVIGTAMVIERVPFRIVGVTPRAFTGLETGRTFDAVIPLGVEPLVRGTRAAASQPRNFTLFVMLRLRPGQPVAAATATMRALQPEMFASLDLPAFAKEPITLVPAAAGIEVPGSARPRYQRPVLAIVVVVGVVLLIACANIANVLFARAAPRRTEVAVRIALGASRWRLVRQWIIESLLLAGLGALGGLALALWGSRLLLRQLSVSLDISLEWSLLGFTVVIAFVTAMLFGIGPALRAARLDPIEALKEQGRSGAAGHSRGLAGALVVVQVALSLALVVGAGLFIRSFTHLASVPLGFDPEPVTLLRVDTSRTLLDAASRFELFNRLVAAVRQAPGVAQASGSTSTPLTGGLPIQVNVPGAPAGLEKERLVLTAVVTPGWFATYGTPIRSGRDFDSGDGATGLPVVVINTAFARMYFPGRDPLGRVVSERTIVGVVADQAIQGGFKMDGAVRSLRDAPPPTMYMPLAQSVSSGPGDRTSITISVRAAPAAVMSAGAMAPALAAVDPAVTFRLGRFADELERTLAQERSVAWLSGFFGVLALLLAGLGLYGVTAHAVSRQRAEFAVRLALGATPGSIVRLVLSRVSRLVGTGIAFGAVVAMWSATYVAALLYGLAPRDVATLVGASVILAAVGAFAGGLPANRASRIDPAAVLRRG